jgi:transcription antitermination factor NusG
VWGYRPGDRVRIVDGTFLGMAGEVLGHEQAEERLRTAEQATVRPTGEAVWVLVGLFGRPVPINLMPDQIEHA